MSKINAARLININYNNNAIRISCLLYTSDAADETISV